MISIFLVYKNPPCPFCPVQYHCYFTFIIMAFISLLIIFLAISSSSVAFTEPVASMADQGVFPEQHGRGHHGVFPEEHGRGHHRGGREEEREENPYVFQSDRFRIRASSEAGEIRALPNFGEVSELLEGISRYRVTCIEMKPNTVMLPHYIDAKWILYVTGGRGYIAYVQQNELVKRKLEEGDVFGVPSGHTFYLVNNDDHNSLRIASLLRTESTMRGEYEPFYVAGGRNPETVYSAFSDDVLEAAFNTDVQKLEHIFGAHRRGVIFHANEEQIREMMRRGGFSAESTSASEQPKPFNLRNQKPDFENDNGRFTRAGPKDNPFLDSVDVTVGFGVLNPGTMTAPSHNTKATSIAIVMEGEGRIEMACPHLGQQHGWSSPRERGHQDINYERVRARLRTGTVYVVPAGHPITEIASTNGRLEILWFDINTSGNERQFLAGKNNVLQTLEKEVRHLSFNIPRGEEIEEVLQAQKDQVILRGPQRQRRDEPRSSS